MFHDGAHNALDVVETTGARRGARRVELPIECVCMRARGRGIAFGDPPALLGRVRRGLGRRNRCHLGCRSNRFGIEVERLELALHRHCVRDQGLDDSFVGGGRQLTSDAALLLFDEGAKAARSFTHGLGAHEPFGELILSQRGQGMLSSENRAVEGPELGVQLGVAGRQLGALVT